MEKDQHNNLINLIASVSCIDSVTGIINNVNITITTVTITILLIINIIITITITIFVILRQPSDYCP